MIRVTVQMSTSLVNRQRERLWLSPVSTPVHPSFRFRLFSDVSAHKNASFHFSASVVWVHTFVHTEVHVPLAERLVFMFP